MLKAFVYIFILFVSAPALADVSIELHTVTLSSGDIYSVTENRLCTEGRFQICSNGTIRYDGKQGLAIGVIGDHTGYQDNTMAEEYFHLESLLTQPGPVSQLYDNIAFIPLKIKGVQSNGRLCDSGESVIPPSKLIPGKILVLMHLSGNPNYPRVKGNGKIETIVSLVKIIARDESSLTIQSRVMQVDREYAQLEVFPSDPSKIDQCD